MVQGTGSCEPARRPNYTRKTPHTTNTPTRQLLFVPLENEEEGWPLGGLLDRRQQVHTAGLQAGGVLAQAEAAVSVDANTKRDASLAQMAAHKGLCLPAVPYCSCHAQRAHIHKKSHSP
jgi:hypothetical protein